ncbi:ABC transporter ATP-binding protein [Aestuariimicrobium sp. p3-SID1156]|uniref:ABC transporter ATP-binding protein n=1 Tax=Aestuariimicrobium sp. p3-SID1156 TaxID=2916038 RepID=UPI00223B5C48|nr:ABC transporter ATP-binding protein [Aestuariimicrobium sp. p3-SID1156]MCT1458721.1 ABC transporter ATP-binding protein [Aestuariimicrobium sp. p3-SID1156]
MTLAVDSLRFRYGKGEELFDGLTHAFTPGAVTALTGPSGRGKSTLLYVLGLLLTPSSGSVLIDGREASRLRDGARSGLRASTIGFVFQDSELDPHRTVIDSVLEPALYAGHRKRAMVGRARELLTEFGLEHRADHRPGQVSGGQAQRLAICRALLNDPPIVLADEPTGNLDRGNAELVLDALCGAARARDHTVVIATHDPYVLTRVDEVVEL